jgi:hypothetical protein
MDSPGLLDRPDLVFSATVGTEFNATWLLSFENRSKELKPEVQAC